MSDPKKITEQTTLGELAVQRAMLGITGLQIFVDLGGGVRGALAHHATGAHIGRGRTEAIAIEEAFASVRELRDNVDPAILLDLIREWRAP